MSHETITLEIRDHSFEYELLSPTLATDSSAVESIAAEALPPEPPQKHENTFQTWASLVLNTWLWEVLAIVFSLLCFIAIACILNLFEDKRRPNLAASRGPLGSLFLVLQHKGQSLVSLGAIVTILALMFEPFMQQILTYPTREVREDPETAEAVARQAFSLATSVSSGWNGIEGEESAADASIILNGIWTEHSEQFEPDLRCFSGNCRWDPFRSMGVCSQCEDVTAQTRLECDPFVVDVTDPDDPEQIETACYINLCAPDTCLFNITILSNVISERDESMLDNATTSTGVTAPQVVVNYAELTQINKTTGLSQLSDLTKVFNIGKVTQCALSACSRTYQISIINGTASINVSPPDFGERFNGSSSACWKSTNTTLAQINLTAPESEFHFCPIQPYTLSGYFNGYMSKWYYFRNLLNGSQNPISALPSNTATLSESPAQDLKHHTVDGTAYVMEVYVSVNWRWFSLPAALIALAIVFLLATMLINRRQRLHLWKSSLLAVLFHGLNDLGNEAAYGDDKTVTANQMEKTAKGIQVRLRSVDVQRGLMLERSRSELELEWRPG
ncbi:hypothetical protein BJY04DRAFT_222079 [Aspergillus karnatakaensis]|uniref:uncharacterized protein n=1 Tax=Aspergillus karnatakaensis TaxID=1810916 RepID=UPI003CCD541D